VLVAGLAVYGLWQLARGDLWLADRLYALEGHRWALRDARLTQHWLHLAGRELSILAWCAVAVAWIGSLLRADLARARRPLAYLVLATATSAGLVAWIKHWSNIDCPWDLARYGGSHAWLGLLQARPPEWGRGICFPAGHASAGYMWLALYFFCVQVRPQWRGRGVAAALLAGGLFGAAQQLRGAHFLSHDLASALLCWGVALALHALFWPPPLRAMRVEARA
jgi:membrane-associated PAP2 superfamily phosphatase